MNYPDDMGYKPCDTLDPRSPFYGESNENHHPRQPAPHPLEQDTRRQETGFNSEDLQD